MLKIVVSWTLYIACVAIIVIGYFVPLVRVVLLKDTSADLSQWLTVSGIGLSVFSLILGAFSNHESSKGSKESVELLKGIQSTQTQSIATMTRIMTLAEHIDEGQKSVSNRLWDIHAVVEMSGQKSIGAGQWPHDPTGAKE